MFKINKNKQMGMTLVELLVVLAIFGAVSTVAIFNFGSFQGQIDIKNLASDIALKTIQAQKSSVSGILPPAAQGTPASTWKPSYGVYFNINPSTENTNFIYFTDLGAENGLYDVSSCPGTGECLEKITITKGNYISHLDVFYLGGTSVAVNDLDITFVRPNSSAVIKSATSLSANISYAQITITSPKATDAYIKVYPSGRIQVN